jgi:hypothetical protein
VVRGTALAPVVGDVALAQRPAPFAGGRGDGVGRRQRVQAATDAQLDIGAARDLVHPVGRHEQ